MLFVCQMRVVIVLLQYKVEEDRTDIEAALPFQMELTVEILY